MWWQSWIFSFMSHDPPEIILICWFAAQETFIIFIIINAESAAFLFKKKYSMNRKFIRTACT